MARGSIGHRCYSTRSIVRSVLATTCWRLSADHGAFSHSQITQSGHDGGSTGVAALLEAGTPRRSVRRLAQANICRVW